MFARLYRDIRVEDAIILIWIAAIEPRVIGSTTSGLDQLTEQGTRLGIFFIVASVASIVAIATRNPTEPTLTWTGLHTPRSYAPLPFIVGLSMIAGLGVENCGIAQADAGFIPVLALGLTAFFLYEHLPSVPVIVRRFLMLPVVLAGIVLFNTAMRGLFSEVDARLLLEAGLGLTLFVIVFSAMFYGLFVFAPGLIVEDEGSWIGWGMRYGIFLAGAFAALAWHAIR